MKKYRVDWGPMPARARRVLLDWRPTGSGMWTRLGKDGLYSSSPVTVEIPLKDGESGTLRARVELASGRIEWRCRTVEIRAKQEVQNREQPEDLTLDDPVVVQEDSALHITPDVPDGQNRDDYEIEVRQGESGRAIEEALFIGICKPGETVRAHAWHSDTSQKIYTRLIRAADDKLSGFQTTTVPVVATVGTDTLDHSSDFSGGTITTVCNGYAPAEAVGGGGFRQKAIYAGTLDGTYYAGNATDVYAGDADLYFGEVTYTTANIDQGAQADVAIMVKPDLNAITQDTLYAGDARSHIIPPYEQLDGTYRDPRPWANGTQEGVDDTPIVAEIKVATSESDDPTFTAADFEDLVPGKVYPRVREYAIKMTLKTWWNRRVTLDNLYVWRYCKDILSCHRKPWSWIETEAAHGFSDGEVVMFNSASTWVKAKGDAAATMPAMGIVTHCMTNSFRIHATGRAYVPSHGLTIDNIYYVSKDTAGALTTTAPSGGGEYVQRFLVPLDANYVYLFGEAEAAV